MDRIVLEKKIDSILRCLKRIEQRLPGSEAAFFKDIDAQDVVVLNLTRAIQTAVDIATHLLASSNQPVPSTMAGSFSSLLKISVITTDIAEKMIKLIGFRNVAVHNYDDIDLTITYTIASQHLNDFRGFIRQVLNYYDSSVETSDKNSG